MNVKFQLPCSLIRKLSASIPPTPRVVPKPERVWHGAPTTIPDEVVLDIRRRHEWLGQTVVAIANALGMNKGTVAHIVDYTTRAKLEPGPKPKDLTP